MILTKEEVLHIAKLARLELTSEEIKKFQTQLSEILDYVSKLQKLEAKGVKPIKQITDLENIVREDKIEPESREVIEKMLNQSPKRSDNLIETLGIFE